MNILHISDLHFGPRHWEGDDNLLLEKINSYDADIVINTGDSTTDGMEDEYKEAGHFLKAINCSNVISIMGNHDKRNMRSGEFFLKYIFDTKPIRLSETGRTTKENLFLNRKITKIDENFTDFTFIKTIRINGKSISIIGLDSNELYSDEGFVEEEVLHDLSEKINRTDYDVPLLLLHHSVLATDEAPLRNSQRVLDFMLKHKIENVFCGHTHELDIRRSEDLYHNHAFTQFMCGTLSSCNHADDDNMFLYFKDFGSDNMHLYLIRILEKKGEIDFKEEMIF